MRKILLAAFAAFVLAAPPAAHAYELTEQDRADVARIERYLNEIKTMQSRFVQVAPHGGHADGTMWMLRPGRLRFEYDPPVKDFVVVTGDFIAHWDGELEVAKHIPVFTTPLAFLLRDEIKLSGKVAVDNIERRAGTIRITLVEREDPGAGAVTLIFEDRPLILRQWQVTDAQGAVTNVAFVDPKFGVPIERRVFQFVEPPRRGGDTR